MVGGPKQPSTPSKKEPGGRPKPRSTQRAPAGSGKRANKLGDSDLSGRAAQPELAATQDTPTPKGFEGWASGSITSSHATGSSDSQSPNSPIPPPLPDEYSSHATGPRPRSASLPPAEIRPDICGGDVARPLPLPLFDDLRAETLAGVQLLSNFSTLSKSMQSVVSNIKYLTQFTNRIHVSLQELDVRLLRRESDHKIFEADLHHQAMGLQNLREDHEKKADLIQHCVDRGEFHSHVGRLLDTVDEIREQVAEVSGVVGVFQNIRPLPNLNEGSPNVSPAGSDLGSRPGTARSAVSIEETARLTSRHPLPDVGQPQPELNGIEGGQHIGQEGSETKTGNWLAERASNSGNTEGQKIHVDLEGSVFRKQLGQQNSSAPATDEPGIVSGTHGRGGKDSTSVHPSLTGSSIGRRVEGKQGGTMSGEVEFGTESTPGSLTASRGSPSTTISPVSNSGINNATSSTPTPHQIDPPNQKGHGVRWDMSGSRGSLVPGSRSGTSPTGLGGPAPRPRTQPAPPIIGAQPPATGAGASAIGSGIEALCQMVCKEQYEGNMGRVKALIDSSVSKFQKSIQIMRSDTTLELTQLRAALNEQTSSRQNEMDRLKMDLNKRFGQAHQESAKDKEDLEDNVRELEEAVGKRLPPLDLSAMHDMIRWNRKVSKSLCKLLSLKEGEVITATQMGGSKGPMDESFEWSADIPGLPPLRPKKSGPRRINNSGKKDDEQNALLTYPVSLSPEGDTVEQLHEEKGSRPVVAPPDAELSFPAGQKEDEEGAGLMLLLTSKPFLELRESMASEFLMKLHEVSDGQFNDLMGRVNHVERDLASRVTTVRCGELLAGFFQKNLEPTLTSLESKIVKLTSEAVMVEDMNLALKTKADGKLMDGKADRAFVASLFEFLHKKLQGIEDAGAPGSGINTTGFAGFHGAQTSEQAAIAEREAEELRLEHESRAALPIVPAVPEQDAGCKRGGVDGPPCMCSKCRCLVCSAQIGGALTTMSSHSHGPMAPSMSTHTPHTLPSPAYSSPISHTPGSVLSSQSALPTLRSAPGAPIASAPPHPSNLQPPPGMVREIPTSPGGEPADEALTDRPSTTPVAIREALLPSLNLHTTPSVMPNSSLPNAMLAQQTQVAATARPTTQPGGKRSIAVPSSPRVTRSRTPKNTEPSIPYASPRSIGRL